MCKLSIIHLVNENSSIISLMLLFSSIFSPTMYVNFKLDIFFAGSTLLHGIKSDGLLGKSHTKLFFAGTEDCRQWKNGTPKRIHSYTLQLICMEGEYDHAYLK